MFQINMLAMMGILPLLSNQIPDSPQIDSQGFWREWLFLGPFARPGGPNPGLPAIRQDYLRTANGITENTVNPVAGTQTPTDFTLAASTFLITSGVRTDINPNSIPTWFSWHDYDDTLHINEIFGGDPDDCVIYAFINVNNKTGSTIQSRVAAASDDSIQVKINGIEQLIVNAVRWVGVSQEIQNRGPYFDLPSGQSRVLVKVFDGGAPSDFRLRLEDTNGKPILSDRISLSPIIDPSPEQVYWVKTQLSNNCNGPLGWYESDFNDSLWSYAPLDDYIENAQSLDRFYRGYLMLDTIPSKIRFWFSSHDGIWVYVNGNFVGHWGAGCHEQGCANNMWVCSYSDNISNVPPVDITSYLQPDINVIAVHVSNRSTTATNFTGYFTASVFFDPEPPLNTSRHYVARSGTGLNGNVYQIVIAPSIFWDDAKKSAENSILTIGDHKVFGHLATITSAEEDLFIEKLRRQGIWEIEGFTEFWVGGYQPPNQATPTSGWQWVNSEGAIPEKKSFKPYANWLPKNAWPDFPQQPDDCCNPIDVENNDENYLGISLANTYMGWNDDRQVKNIMGYVVEYDAPEPENQPPQITHTPITSAIQNKNIKVEFEAKDPDGILSSVEVFYRITGASDYQSVGISPDPSQTQFTLEIPANFVTLAGVDYYIEAKDTEGATKTTPVYHICVEQKLEKQQLKIFRIESGEPIESGSFIDFSVCRDVPDEGAFNPEYGTVVFVHGWNYKCGKDINLEIDGSEGWVLQLAKAIAKRLDGKVNILAWDWLKEAENTDGSCDTIIPSITKIPYARVPDQAKKLSLELQKLFERKEYSLNMPIHFIGHSLGAHVVAQCGKLMVERNKDNPTKYYPWQISCMEPPSNYPADIVNLEDLCYAISSIRFNKDSVYTELYDGTFNQFSRKFLVFVDVPYLGTGALGHDVYKWYIKTVSEDFDVQILDRAKLNVNANPVILGTLGFGTSCILGEDVRRLNLTCPAGKESLNFDYRWESDGKQFTYEGCLSYQCGTKVTVVEGNYFNSTPMFIIVGEDDGSSFEQGTLKLKAKSNETVDGIFEFGNYPNDSDFIDFEWMWYKEPGLGGGGEVQVLPYAEFQVFIESEERTLLVFEVNTLNASLGETQNSGFIDMREFHGKPVTFTFRLTTTDSSLGAQISNITSSEWQGRENQPPQADAGDDIQQIAEKDGTALIQLCATGSADPESGELQYQWYEIIGEDEFTLSTEQCPMVRFSIGTHQIKLCAYDEYFAQGCDEVLVEIQPNPESFVRGDSNQDGAVDISDAVNTLGFLFTDTGEVTCEDAADANDDGGLDISDAVYTLSFLFLGGKDIPPPYPNTGSDFTPDTLGCRE